ncbi:hypothetical protein D3C81_1585600 [compost metagenome]
MGNAPLAFDLRRAALQKTEVALARRQAQPAMQPPHQALLAQVVDVTPDRLRADLEAIGKLVGAEFAGIAQPVEDFTLSRS